MFGTIKRMGLKRAAVLTTTVLVGMVGAVLLASPASAHNFNVIGATTQCDASTGTYTITYQGDGDYNLTSTVTVDSQTPAGSTVTPQVNPDVKVIVHNGTYSNPFTVVQSGIAGTATSASITVTEKWSDGFALQQSSANVVLSGDCIKSATPSFTDNVCSGYSPAGASYTIPSTPGITYSVNHKTVAAGTYPATDGQTVVVYAYAGNGYTLSGQTSFTHTFGSTPTCTTTTTATSPSFSNDVCVDYSATGSSYTIPSTPGVYYTINGRPVVAKTYSVADGKTVIVEAHAKPGFTLTGTTKWTHEFGSAPTCTTTTEVASPKFTDDVCHTTTATGASYTVTAATGVVYKVNGTAVAAGTYPAVDGSTVTIIASPLAGYTLSGTASFTHTYTAAPICAAASATLAFTGTSTSVPATVGIGAALLAVGGLLLAGAGRLGRRTN